MPAYFERLDDTTFRATPAVAGVWNTAEQHIAPAMGLLTAMAEATHHSQRGERLQLGRISFDILGTLPIDIVEVSTKVVRPGRSIELVEATLAHGGRPALIARAWFAQSFETTSIAGTSLPPMPGRETLERARTAEAWEGAFVETVEVHRHEHEPGRASFWIRPLLPLLDDEPISLTARMFGMVDIANGLGARVSPANVLFPNLELTAHLFREPETDWIGCDTTASIGAAGIGLTHTVLHDERGPIGTSQQTLTVRPR